MSSFPNFQSEQAPSMAEALAEGRSLKDFVVHEILSQREGFTLLGSFSTDPEDRPAILKITLKPPFVDNQALTSALPDLSVVLNTYSGAEYAFYDAELSRPIRLEVEAILPASDAQIRRYRPAQRVIVEETKEVYDTIVRPFQEAQLSKLGWIESVISRQTEKFRNLFDGDEYIINVDTKWKSHGNLSEDPEVRKTWYQASWTSDLYILAISKDPSLLSMRDLKGEEGAGLCDRMRRDLLDCAKRVYGVPEHKLRVFFHYPPQFYRLHAHCTVCSSVLPGCEVERAHLLTDVGQNLRLFGDYYSRVSISCVMRENEELYSLVKEGALD